MRIAWFIDDPTWAFGIGQKSVAERLPEYIHEVFTADDLNQNPNLIHVMASCDVIVCPWPVWLERFHNLSNVVASLKSMKVFQTG